MTEDRKPRARRNATAREVGRPAQGRPNAEADRAAAAPRAEGARRQTTMRLIALGASNLTRGLGTVVALARGAWGPEIELMGALGIGRSYGAPSRIVVRVLPSILDCGLWRALDALPPAPTRAIVTDVGNDILYGFPTSQILSWVAQAVERLRRHTDDIAIAGLPLASMGQLSPAKFLFVRTLLVPACRLAFDQVAGRAIAVNAGLEALAARHGARFVDLPGQWYARDPVHFRLRARSAAWRTVLGAGEVPAAPLTWPEAARLWRAWPAEQRLLGLVHRTPQTGTAVAPGVVVRLY